jgi:hypothetical protein
MNNLKQEQKYWKRIYRKTRDENQRKVAKKHIDKIETEIEKLDKKQ